MTNHAIRQLQQCSKNGNADVITKRRVINQPAPYTLIFEPRFARFLQGEEIRGSVDCTSSLLTPLYVQHHDFTHRHRGNTGCCTTKLRESSRTSSPIWRWLLLTSLRLTNELRGAVAFPINLPMIRSKQFNKSDVGSLPAGFPYIMRHFSISYV